MEDLAQTTRLLQATANGDAVAAKELLPHVYGELRGLAAKLMQSERKNHTLDPTELIHEAYLRLVREPGPSPDDAGAWEGRAHFRRIAARAMRRVLIDHARARLTDKRSHGRRTVTLDTQLSAVANSSEKLVFVHDGLEELGHVDEQLAQIVEMRFFGGMTIDEIAIALGVSKRTVERGWRLAKAWWISEFAEGATGEQ